jgi:NADH-quinone oxidoreductase subunit E
MAEEASTTDEAAAIARVQAAAVTTILARHAGRPDSLLPILIDVQEEVGYLPEDGVARIAEFIGSDTGQVYSVASFYSQFRLTPVGRHHIRLCRGTACHVRGAPRILDELETATGLAEGETSLDLTYTLETVACIGCCALAPAVKINDDVHGEITPDRAREIVKSLPAKDADGG